MQHSQGFPPIAAGRPAVLVLGSLPGRRSLEEVQYYAQPQNSFWRIMGELFGAGPALPYAERRRRLTRIMGELFGAGPALPYAERRRRLTRSGVAVWDVLASAHRPGSLDSAIDKSSMQVNDFAWFFARYPGIRLVCFNGKTAAELYRRHVAPGLSEPFSGLPARTLPSTSPAHASMSYRDKLERWASVLAAAALAGPAVS